jgi:hypothetical protein
MLDTTPSEQFHNLVMNGIELVCGTKTQSSTGHTVTSKVGPWGSWYRSFTKCDQPEFLTSFNLQVERPIVSKYVIK